MHLPWLGFSGPLTKMEPLTGESYLQLRVFGNHAAANFFTGMDHGALLFRQVFAPRAVPQLTVAATVDSPGKFIRVTTITSGSGTHTLHPKCKVFRVIVQGGGGGGGGGDGGATTAGAGAGGGGGGYSELTSTQVNFGNFAYQIGTGGAGGIAGNNAGTGGNVSSFDNAAGGGSIIVAGNGGVGGPSMLTGTSIVNSSAAAGGTGSGGDLNIQGGLGKRGWRLNGTFAVGGDGGKSQLGSGGTGAANLVGGNGIAFGGGGGGGSAVAAGDTAGGDGADGCVVVYEYE